MRYHKVCFFSCRTKKNRNLLDYQYVEHRVEIVSQDREYSNVDAIHEHAMLLTRNEGRFTEKHAGIKKKKRYEMGNETHSAQ